MGPERFGKRLGIGLRVAGNIARDRIDAAARKHADAPVTPPAAARAQVLPPVVEVTRQQAEKVTAKGVKIGHGLGRGTRQFSRSFFGPVAHAGGVLWLEITGCFFALFALVCAQNVYRIRAQYAAGPDHRQFLLSCLLTAGFAYFSASSFVRARRRWRKQAAGK